MDYQQLNDQELFHLAIDAIHRNNHSEAIILLKNTISQNENEPRFFYLLGVEYAEIGLFSLAKEMLTKAISLTPLIDMAAFQLGLLHLTLGDTTAACTVWTKLDHLKDTESLFWFRKGLEALIDNDIAGCKSALQQGIQAENSLPALNNDMELLLTQLDDNEQTSSGHTMLNLNRASFLIQGYIDNDDAN